MNQPYYTGPNVYEPRYYQRIAINRTVEAVASGQNRILLVMATGTGKTYTAFQIVYRLLQSGLKRKVLYLADRNILVDQSIQQDFAPLEKVIHKINYAKDDPTTITSYQVYFSLYHIMTLWNSPQYKNGLLDTIVKLNSKSIRVRLDTGKEVTILLSGSSGSTTKKAWYRLGSSP